MPFDNRDLTGSMNTSGFLVNVDQLDRAKSELGIIYTLAASGVAVPLTGTTANTTLATIIVPGGILGPTGSLRITALFSATNNANQKTPRVQFGGVSFYSAGLANWSSIGVQALLFNRTEQSQIATPINVGSVWSASANALTTMGIDTKQDQALAIQGQLAVGTDTMTLESYLVEVFPS